MRACVCRYFTIASREKAFPRDWVCSEGVAITASHLNASFEVRSM